MDLIPTRVPKPYTLGPLLVERIADGLFEKSLQSTLDSINHNRGGEKQEPKFDVAGLSQLFNSQVLAETRLGFDVDLLALRNATLLPQRHYPWKRDLIVPRFNIPGSFDYSRPMINFADDIELEKKEEEAATINQSAPKDDTKAAADEKRSMEGDPNHPYTNLPVDKVTYPGDTPTTAAIRSIEAFVEYAVGFHKRYTTSQAQSYRVSAFGHAVAGTDTHFHQLYLRLKNQGKFSNTGPTHVAKILWEYLALNDPQLLTMFWLESPVELNAKLTKDSQRWRTQQPYKRVPAVLRLDLDTLDAPGLSPGSPEPEIDMTQPEIKPKNPPQDPKPKSPPKRTSPPPQAGDESNSKRGKTSPGGTVTTPKGTVATPKGTVTTPKGTVTTPGGTTRKPPTPRDPPKPPSSKPPSNASPPLSSGQSPPLSLPLPKVPPPATEIPVEAKRSAVVSRALAIEER